MAPARDIVLRLRRAGGVLSCEWKAPNFRMRDGSRCYAAARRNDRTEEGNADAAPTRIEVLESGVTDVSHVCRPFGKVMDVNTPRLEDLLPVDAAFHDASR